MHGNYTVKAGDSLMSIAARAGNVTPAQLARFNKLGMLGVGQPPLFPGQRLYIPNDDELTSQNVRLRHLPGAATRVRYVSADFSDNTSSSKPGVFSESSQRNTFSSRLNAYGRRSTSLIDTDADVMERLFVKLNAERVLLPSKTHVDGILIVTPDAVCFDALATASALNQAMRSRQNSKEFFSGSSVTSETESRESRNPQLENNGGATSSSVDEPVVAAREPIHDVLSLSVCIPISALISLNTHGNIDELLVGRRKRTGSILTNKEDFHVSSGKTINVEYLPETASIEDHNKTNFDLTANESSMQSIESGLSKSPTREIAEAPEFVYVSIGVDTSRISSCESLPNCSTLLEAASSDCHIFRIPLNKLSNIHNILVSATNLAYSQKCTSSLQFDSDASIPPSLIETALREMEDTPFRLSLRNADSQILTVSMLKDLSEGLPSNWTGSGMQLIFSTDRDGFSLNSLYRKATDVKNISLLLILDTTETTFGAVLSERMRCSPHFYGTGESCVFHWKPDFKRFDWTKKNYFFMCGAPDCFLIGAKSGHSAIWFDSALKYGRSEATDTFGNPVLCGQSRQLTPSSSLLRTASKSSLTSGKDVCPSSVPFIIEQLEVWEMVA